MACEINDRRLNVTAAFACKLEAENVALMLNRTGDFPRSGKLTESMASMLVDALHRNEGSLHHFLRCLNHALTGKRCAFWIDIRVAVNPPGIERMTVRDYLVEVYDTTGIKVDGFIHRLDLCRPFTMQPARRWQQCSTRSLAI